MKLYAAAYMHDCGTKIRVFRSKKSAMAWKVQIAKDYWEDFFDGPPVDLCDEEIADQYFETIPEYFELDEVEIEE